MEEKETLFGNTLEDRAYVFGLGHFISTIGESKSKNGIEIFPTLEFAITNKKISPGTVIHNLKIDDNSVFCKTRIIFTDIKYLIKLKEQLEYFIESFENKESDGRAKEA